jgi:hypothetical protein
VIGDAVVVLRDNREEVLQTRQPACEGVALHHQAGETDQFSHSETEDGEGWLQEVVQGDVGGVDGGKADELEGGRVCLPHALRLPEEELQVAHVQLVAFLLYGAPVLPCVLPR